METMRSRPGSSGVAGDIAQEAGCGCDISPMGGPDRLAPKAFVLESTQQKVLHALKDKSVLIAD
jgi:hypothetical protein